MTEEDRWICCAQAGDHDAFRHLWEAHHAVAMAAALRLCHHRGLAEDITQGAFVLAWRGLPRFRRGAPFRPWLLRIVFRHALDVMEQQRLSRQAVSLDLLLQEDGRTQAAIVFDEEDLSSQLAQRELVRVALVSLSPEQRRVVALRYGADLTEQQIASVLGWSLGTVKSRLHRARKHLQQQLNLEGRTSHV